MQHVKSHEQSENEVKSNNAYAHEKSGSREAMKDDIGNKKKIKSQGLPRVSVSLSLSLTLPSFLLLPSPSAWMH